jgi:hypothetical protein
MKASLKQIKMRLGSIKPWYLLALTIISAIVCLNSLRTNNEHMNYLRNQVYAADSSNGNVEIALENLARYVTSNMNTNLSSGANSIYPPIQLTHSYNRVTSSQTAAIEQQNSTLYTQAENYCQQLIPEGFSGRYRIPCIEQYVTTHGLKGAAIPDSLYEFDFISPTWSPDLAGWSMLLTIVLAIPTLISFAFHFKHRRDIKIFNR